MIIRKIEVPRSSKILILHVLLKLEEVKGIRSVGISRTPRRNVWNGGHEWANHPLRGSLISNYLIKICLRRGASYAPFELVLHLLLVS